MMQLAQIIPTRVGSLPMEGSSTTPVPQHGCWVHAVAQLGQPSDDTPQPTLQRDCPLRAVALSSSSL